MEKLREMTRDTRILMFELKKRRKDIIFWFSVVFAILFIYIFISSKDFSFFLVLSSIVQTSAFVIILLKVTDRQNVSGLSANTLICYSILLFARLTSTLFYPGYLPNDSSGSWLYQLSDIISMLICCLLIYLLYFKYRETSDLILDNKIPFYFLVVPSYLLAVLVKSNLNNNFFVIQTGLFLCI